MGQTFFFFLLSAPCLDLLSAPCLDSGEFLVNDKENSSHVDERGFFILEGDGSVVGDVCFDDAFRFSHLVTGVVQLTHLSQAGWQKREKLEGL